MHNFEDSLEGHCEEYTPKPLFLREGNGVIREKKQLPKLASHLDDRATNVNTGR